MDKNNIIYHPIAIKIYLKSFGLTKRERNFFRINFDREWFYFEIVKKKWYLFEAVNNVNLKNASLRKETSSSYVVVPKPTRYSKRTRAWERQVKNLKMRRGEYKPQFPRWQRTWKRTWKRPREVPMNQLPVFLAGVSRLSDSL